MKQEITINSDQDRWEKFVTGAAFQLIEDSFAIGKTRSDCNFKIENSFGMAYEYTDSYTIPENIMFDWVGGGIVPVYDAIITDKACQLKNGRLVYKKNKEHSTFVLTSEYCLSNREFERHAHRNIKRHKDKKNFWAIIAVRAINPFLDYIEAGMAMGYDND